MQNAVKFSCVSMGLRPKLDLFPSLQTSVCKTKTERAKPVSRFNPVLIY